MTKVNAIVTKVMRLEGYAFAKGEDDQSLFILKTTIPDVATLEPGDVITAQAVQTPKGWRAKSATRQITLIPTEESADGNN